MQNNRTMMDDSSLIKSILPKHYDWTVWWNYEQLDICSSPRQLQSCRKILGSRSKLLLCSPPWPLWPQWWSPPEMPRCQCPEVQVSKLSCPCHWHHWRYNFQRHYKEIVSKLVNMEDFVSDSVKLLIRMKRASFINRMPVLPHFESNQPGCIKLPFPKIFFFTTYIFIELGAVL